MPIFESLRAAFIGLGGAECQQVYPCKMKLRKSYVEPPNEPPNRPKAKRRQGGVSKQSPKLKVEQGLHFDVSER